MNNAGKVAFWTNIIFALTGIIVTLTEIPYMSQDQNLYLVLRLITILPIFGYAYLQRKDPYRFIFKLLFVLNITAYNCIGYVFRPMYLFSFTQIIFFFSFLYSTTRKEFLFFAAIMYTGFLTTSLLTYENLPYHRGEESIVDLIVTPLTSVLIAFMVHHFFTAERRIRDVLYERFSSLGRMSTTIVHDIKGSLSAPIMVLDSLEESIQRNKPEEAFKQIQILRRSLSGLSGLVFQLNQLSNVSNIKSTSETFNFSECLKDAKVILEKRLYHINLSVSGDLSLTGSKELFTSIILNILINSLDEFKIHNISQGTIKVTVTKNEIHFEDNGKGFETELIKKIKAGEILTTKESGSGLGLYLVKESLKSFNGKLELLSSKDGGHLKIRFK